MTNLPKELHQRLRDLANSYARILKSRVVKALERYSATGTLIDSIDVFVIPGKGDKGPEIRMTYDEHGDFLTKKKMLFVKVPPVDDLQEWTEAKNIGTSHIPGYSEGSIPGISDQKKKERIAWAIGADKRINDTWKRRNWKRKPISALLKEINVEILRAYQVAAEKEIASFISNT